MQSSQRAATETAIAISSFVLPSRAPSAIALWARVANAFITSGAPPRSDLSSVLRPRVKSGQFLGSMSSLLYADPFLPDTYANVRIFQSPKRPSRFRGTSLTRRGEGDNLIAHAYFPFLDARALLAREPSHPLDPLRRRPEACGRG